MTDKEKYELGIELIAGMHAARNDGDMIIGRSVRDHGLKVLPECPPEYLDSHCASVQQSNLRIQKQAPFMAEVAINKLIQMGYNVLKR